MARYTGPRCKLMRRERLDLSLVSNRRGLEGKCKLEVPPGMHGSNSGGKVSEFATQLREKQKIRRMYGILERQFRKYFNLAAQRKGSTGNNLIDILESRLDNVVYRMGFGCTRAEARQLVSHGSIMVNDRSVNIPSYSLKSGDKVAIKPKAQKQLRIQESLALAKNAGFPLWVEVNETKMEGVFKHQPQRQDLSSDINEQLVVEFYSK